MSKWRSLQARPVRHRAPLPSRDERRRAMIRELYQECRDAIAATRRDPGIDRDSVLGLIAHNRQWIARCRDGR